MLYQTVALGLVDIKAAKITLSRSGYRFSNCTKTRLLIVMYSFPMLSNLA